MKNVQRRGPDSRGKKFGFLYIKRRTEIVAEHVSVRLEE